MSNTNSTHNININANTSQAQAKIGGLSSMVGNLGGLMAVAFVVSTLVNWGKAAGKIIIDFGKAQSELAAILGTTRDGIRDLEADSLRLGKSTEYTATEVSRLQKEYAKLGFSKDEIVDVTEATLDLATATGSDLSKAAEVAGATLRGFGLSTTETGHLTDVMAKSFASSALDIDRFAESMSYVAPIARVANIDVETTTALLGKLADVGIHGSKAGTGLKRILSELGDENSKLSKKLGYSVKNSSDLERAFSDLNKMNIDLTQSTDLVGRIAAASFSSLINEADGASILTEELRNADGASQQMADTMRDNLSGDIDKATSAIEGFVLALSNGDDEVSNVFRSITQEFTDFVGSVTDLFSKDGKTQLKGATKILVKDGVMAPLRWAIGLFTDDVNNWLDDTLDKIDGVTKESVKKQKKRDAEALKLQTDQQNNFLNLIKSSSNLKWLEEQSKKKNEIYSKEALKRIQILLEEKQKEEDAEIKAEEKAVKLHEKELKRISDAKIKKENSLKDKISLIDEEYKLELDINSKLSEDNQLTNDEKLKFDLEYYKKKLSALKVLAKLSGGISEEEGKAIDELETKINSATKTIQKNSDTKKADKNKKADKKAAQAEIDNIDKQIEALNKKYNLDKEIDEHYFENNVKTEEQRQLDLEKYAEYTSQMYDLAVEKAELDGILTEKELENLEKLRKARDKSAEKTQTSDKKTLGEKLLIVNETVGAYQDMFGSLLEAQDLFGIKSRALQKALTLGQIATNMAQAISSLVAYSEGNPLNALTMGAAGVAQFAAGMARILAGVAQAHQVLSKAEKGMLVGKSHAQGGKIIEAEGGEAIINKKSVSMFAPELSAINQLGGGVPIGNTTSSLIDYEKLAGLMNSIDVRIDSTEMSKQQKINTKIEDRANLN